MTPVHQTIYGKPDGNCFAACVASILDKKIEDVDVDVKSCGGSLESLVKKIEQRADCKIDSVPYEAILAGDVKRSERYCIAKVCSFLYNNNPDHENSMWHAVVCEIADGRILLKYNPNEHDKRPSLQDFPVGGQLFFVKPR